jgi:hypothetical protein
MDRRSERTGPATADTKLAARNKREAEALRANLRKRKDQTRAREQPNQDKAAPGPARNE